MGDGLKRVAAWHGGIVWTGQDGQQQRLRIVPIQEYPGRIRTVYDDLWRSGWLPQCRALVLAETDTDSAFLAVHDYLVRQAGGYAGLEDYSQDDCFLLVSLITDFELINQVSGY